MDIMVITYSISGETQAPKMLTTEDIEILKAMAKTNPLFEINTIRHPNAKELRGYRRSH